MQNRPTDAQLLDAMAAFLVSDVAPALEADKALQFRVIIAANLASVVASERRSFEARFQAEAAGLKALVPGAGEALSAAKGDAARAEALEALNRALAQRLRGDEADDAFRAQALAHLFETARATLEVTNPRFDLSETP